MPLRVLLSQVRDLFALYKTRIWMQQTDPGNNLNATRFLITCGICAHTAVCLDAADMLTCLTLNGIACNRASLAFASAESLLFETFPLCRVRVKCNTLTVDPVAHAQPPYLFCQMMMLLFVQVTQHCLCQAMAHMVDTLTLLVNSTPLLLLSLLTQTLPTMLTLQLLMLMQCMLNQLVLT